MIDTSKPLCVHSRNKAFLNPVNSDKFKIAAAVRICESCPLLKSCATAGLTAGNLPDGSTRSVADEVIMAGVVCRGDQGTVDALRAVGGLPAHRQPPRARIVPPRAYVQDGQPCRECSTPMVRWTRDESEIPEGWRKHYGRGFCTGCRQAYKAFLASSSKRQTRPVQRRTRHCVDCDAPMVPYAHDLPTDSHVRHMARGRCTGCYNKARRRVKDTHLTANCLQS